MKLLQQLMLNYVWYIQPSFNMSTASNCCYLPNSNPISLPDRYLETLKLSSITEDLGVGSHKVLIDSDG